MTHNELVEAIGQDTNMSKTVVKAVLSSLGDVVCGALTDNQEVTILKIGKFSVKERAARPGINLQTKEKVMYKARNVPKFSVARALKDAALVSS